MDKVEYFLNAIHYCIYLEEVWSNKKIDNMVTKILAVFHKIPFLTKYIKNLCTNKQSKKFKVFTYGKNFGLSISVANHCFGYLYSSYPASLSFALAGLALRELGSLSSGLTLILLIIPIGLCYIPAYKAVFSNDRYQKYFKQFEKEDERWHRKWKRITFAFCIGGVITETLGICAAFAIFMA